MCDCDDRDDYNSQEDAYVTDLQLEIAAFERFVATVRAIHASGDCGNALAEAIATLDKERGNV